MKKSILSWSPSIAATFIEDFEGRRLTAYKCPAGRLTIGVGHAGPEVREGMTITDGQADELLIGDIRKVAEDLSRYINHDVTRGQYIALVSLAFNLGAYGVITGCPKLMRKLNDGDIDGAAKEFLDCDRVGGKRLPGLTRRRRAEADLFLGAD